MSGKGLLKSDRSRCQAEVRGGSFMTLGPREWVRCANAPVVIATEKVPGTDGKRGSMSLCADCQGAMLKQLGRAYATFKAIGSHR